LTNHGQINYGLNTAQFLLYKGTAMVAAYTAARISPENIQYYTPQQKDNNIP